MLFSNIRLRPIDLLVSVIHVPVSGSDILCAILCRSHYWYTAGCQLEPCNNARLTCECRHIDRSRPAGQLIFRGADRLLLTIISFPINS
jgi:hypothetical protein